jgi:hypothetical protein
MGSWAQGHIPQGNGKIFGDGGAVGKAGWVGEIRTVIENDDTETNFIGKARQGQGDVARTTNQQPGLGGKHVKKYPQSAVEFSDAAFFLAECGCSLVLYGQINILGPDGAIQGAVLTHDHLAARGNISGIRCNNRRQTESFTAFQQLFDFCDNIHI